MKSRPARGVCFQSFWPTFIEKQSKIKKKNTHKANLVGIFSMATIDYKLTSLLAIQTL